MKIFSKTSLVIIILLLLVGAYAVYSYYEEAKRAIEAGIERDRQEQNTEAYKDSLEMKARELQDIKVFVNDLQDENTQLNKEVAYIKSKFVLLLDSVEVLNRGTTSYNYGDSIVVSFEGKEGKISYKGKTIYFTVADTGMYSIKIWQDPLEISSYIYLNEEDGLIYHKIYADSVLIDDAYTVVDSALYKKLKMPTFIKIGDDLGFFSRLSIYGEIIQPFNSDDVNWAKPNLNLGIQYNFKNGLGLQGGRDLMYEKWYIGARYSLTLTSIWSFIF